MICRCPLTPFGVRWGKSQVHVAAAGTLGNLRTMESFQMLGDILVLTLSWWESSCFF